MFPVHYSTLSADALLDLVTGAYAVSKNAEITYLKRGFNDTYRIDSGKERFILRVYKQGWRNKNSIETEVRLLHYLKDKGISVSFPIADNNGNFLQEIAAPEGARYAVLFSFAEGEQVRKLSIDQAKLLGQETARIHLLTQDLELGETAQEYGIEVQFEKALRILKPVLITYPAEYNYLLRLQNEFLEHFRGIDKGKLSKGLCHGDLQAENFHLDETGRITFFDLDFFGTGYLAYDIGIFTWYDHKNKPKEVLNAFFDGYQSKKPLSPEELSLIPWFSTLRALFQMSLYCELSDGKHLPLWPASEVAKFVGKLRAWHESAQDRSRS